MGRENAIHIESFLGSARLAPYLHESSGDIDRAVDLYRWNCNLAGAWHTQFSYFEVMVRNAMDRALADWNQTLELPASWSLRHHANDDLYRLIRSPLKYARRRAESEAQSRSRHQNHPRYGQPVSHDDIVTQLTFGSWSSLLGEGLSWQRACETDTLWYDALHNAFPYARINASGRRYIGKRLERMRQLRNRISHQENLLRINVNDRLRDMLTVLSSIGPNYPTWAMADSRVRQVAREDPRKQW